MSAFQISLTKCCKIAQQNIDQTKNKTTDLTWKTLTGKTTERTKAYHYNRRSITMHERTNPSRAMDLVDLSQSHDLIYDYMELYMGDKQLSFLADTKRSYRHALFR